MKGRWVKEIKNGPIILDGSRLWVSTDGVGGDGVCRSSLNPSEAPPYSILIPADDQASVLGRSLAAVLGAARPHADGDVL